MSAVQWLNTLPPNCGRKRLKYAAPLRASRNKGSEESDDYIGLENIESWTGRKVFTNGPSEISTSDSSIYGTTSSFIKGNVLFGKLRPYLAKALFAEHDGICTTELLVLQPSADLNPRFLLYVLLCPEFVNLVDSSTFGAKMPRANWDFIGTVHVPIPEFFVQRLIANYLDRETAQIDALIKEKERMLSLLEEKRAALISRAVTCGLDTDAPLKSSGYPWLGDIPAHWELRRCASLFKEIDERNEPDLPLLNVSLNTGVTLRVFSDNKIESVAADFATYKVARKGNLVFNKMRFWQGAVGIAPKDGLTSPDYTVAELGPGLNADYIELLFRIPQFIMEVRRYSHGIVDDRLRLYWDGFKNIRIPIPPPHEQKLIVDHLADERAKTAVLETALQDSIVLLKERRSALITAAVTGRIEIPEISPEKEVRYAH